jgi:hypothetical protein
VSDGSLAAPGFFLGGFLYIYARLAAVPLLYFCFVFVAFGSHLCGALLVVVVVVIFGIQGKHSFQNGNNKIVRTWPGFPTNSFVVVFG